VLGLGPLDGPPETEDVEVGARDLDAERVAVDPGDGQSRPGEGDQVAADPTADVEDRPRVGEGDAGGPMPGDAPPGGLLEALGGEVEAVCEVTELRPRPQPQLDLGEGCGDVGRVGVAAQHAGGSQGVPPLLGVHRRGPLQQTLSSRREQPPEGLQVHSGQSGTRLDRVLITA